MQRSAESLEIIANARWHEAEVTLSVDTNARAQLESLVARAQSSRRALFLRLRELALLPSALAAVALVESAAAALVSPALAPVSVADDASPSFEAEVEAFETAAAAASEFFRRGAACASVLVDSAAAYE